MTEISKEVIDALPKEAVAKLLINAGESPSAEVGKILTDLVKSLRLIGFPLQLLAASQDRLSNFIQQAVDKVPSEQRIDAPSNISGPILEQVVNLEDENFLYELFNELLARAIDKSRAYEAHPAFVEIIKHLAPDETLILRDLSVGTMKIKKITEDGVSTEHVQFVQHKSYRAQTHFSAGKDYHIENLVFPDNFRMYLSHVISLNLVRKHLAEEDKVKKGMITHVTQTHAYELTRFGVLFVRACMNMEIPDEMMAD